MKEVKKMSGQAMAAKEIRAYMKANGIVGSVRSESFSMGDSVNVSVVDLMPAAYKALSEFARKFQYGSFNGMEDIYEYDNYVSGAAQSKYVFVGNEMSNEMAQNIYEYACGYFAGMENAPASYKDAYNFRNENFGKYAGDLVRGLFNGGDYNNQYYDYLNSLEQLAA